MTTPLSVKELLSFGWNTFKKRPWFFVGTFVAYAALQLFLGALQEKIPGIASFLLSLVVSTLAYLALITMYLKAHEDPMKASWNDAWNPKPFWSYLGASILLAIVVLAGLILLIIPGIYLAIALSLTGYLVVDRGMGPLEAMKESFRLTRGNRFKLFLFGVAAFVLGFLGSLPLFLGLLVVAPVVMLSGVHAYRELSHGAAEVVPAATQTPAAS